MKSIGWLSVTQSRRRAGGAGQSDAEILPRRPRHQRAAGEGRSQQRGLTVRSLHLLPASRRRVGEAGQPDRRACLFAEGLGDPEQLDEAGRLERRRKPSIGWIEARLAKLQEAQPPPK
jgi:hypothetical protein